MIRGSLSLPFPFVPTPPPFSCALHFCVSPTIWEPGTGYSNASLFHILSPHFALSSFPPNFCVHGRCFFNRTIQWALQWVACSRIWSITFTMCKCCATLNSHFWQVNTIAINPHLVKKKSKYESVLNWFYSSFSSRMSVLLIVWKYGGCMSWLSWMLRSTLSLHKHQALDWFPCFSTGISEHPDLARG